MGVRGDTSLQNLELDCGREVHVLVGGDTGVGKSNTLNVIITNLAASYAPSELQMYLLDFKDGLEFKPYETHRLPHALDTLLDREPGSWVESLRAIEEELISRIERFRQAGVGKDYRAYRKKFPDQVLPRILVVMDEFQRLFVETNQDAKKAGGSLNRLAQQGRAAGIHLILATQTFNSGNMGSFGPDQGILDQFRIRIAMGCSEAASQLILKPGNDAAGALPRSGAAIYNADSGQVGSNQEFQVARLEDDIIQNYVTQMAVRAELEGIGNRHPKVFKEDQPSVPDATECLVALTDFLKPGEKQAGMPCLLGKTSTDTTVITGLTRQSGMNLAVLGNHEALAVKVLASATLSLAWFLAKQALAVSTSEDKAIVLLSTGGDFEEALIGPLEQGFPGMVREVVNPDEFEAAVGNLHADLNGRRGRVPGRTGPAVSPSRVLVVHGLHRVEALDGGGYRAAFPLPGAAGPSLTQMVQDLLEKGPEYGIFTLLWCDSPRKLEAKLGVEAVQALTNRVVLYMGERESFTAIGPDDAARLKRDEALLKDAHGGLRKIKPFSLVPDLIGGRAL